MQTSQCICIFNEVSSVNRLKTREKVTPLTCFQAYQLAAAELLLFNLVCSLGFRQYQKGVYLVGVSQFVKLRFINALIYSIKFQENPGKWV